MPEQQTKRGNQITGSNFEAVEIRTARGAVAIVSPEDGDLGQHRWYLGTNGYFMRYIGGGRKAAQQQTLHREIMLRLGPARSSQIVDHINRNKLDCRRENLRWVTPAQSSWNHAGQGSSGRYKGVYWNGCSFYARICTNGKDRYLGSFKSAEDAARAYDRSAREIAGEFAYVNFPVEIAHA